VKLLLTATPCIGSTRQMWLLMQQRVDFFLMQQVNASYKTNLEKLNSLVLVMFENDTMVEPRESEVGRPITFTYCWSIVYHVCSVSE